MNNVLHSTVVSIARHFPLQLTTAYPPFNCVLGSGESFAGEPALRVKVLVFPIALLALRNSIFCRST